MANRAEVEKFSLDKSYSKDEFIFLCEGLASQPGMPESCVKALRLNIAWAEAGRPEYRIIWVKDLYTGEMVPKWFRDTSQSELADTKGLL